MPAKSLHSIRTSVGALFYFKVVNNSFFVKCSIMIDTDTSYATTFITNVSEVSFMAGYPHLCLSIGFTHPAVSMAFTVVYFLKVSCPVSKLTFALLRARKNIHRTISILISISRKMISKNQTLPRLFYKKNLAETRSYIFKKELSIFWAPMLFIFVVKAKMIANADVIALTSLLKSIQAL